MRLDASCLGQTRSPLVRVIALRCGWEELETSSPYQDAPLDVLSFRYATLCFGRILPTIAVFPTDANDGSYQRFRLPAQRYYGGP